MLGIVEKIYYSALVFLAILIFPAQAQATCANQRSAAASDWAANANKDSGSFDVFENEILGFLRQTPDWNDATKLAVAAKESPAFSPLIDAYLLCVVEQRLAELQKPMATSASPTQRGLSNFGSGGSVSASTENAAATKAQAPGCGLEASDSSTGALSTESMTLRNTCSTRVSFAYCVISDNGGGSFSCEQQKFGTDEIGGNGTGYLSVMGASTPFEAHWGYCIAANAESRPFPSNPHWDGKQVQVQCH